MATCNGRIRQRHLIGGLILVLAGTGCLNEENCASNCECHRPANREIRWQAVDPRPALVAVEADIDGLIELEERLVHFADRARRMTSLQVRLNRQTNGPDHLAFGDQIRGKSIRLGAVVVDVLVRKGSTVLILKNRPAAWRQDWQSSSSSEHGLIELSGDLFLDNLLIEAQLTIDRQDDAARISRGDCVELSGTIAEAQGMRIRISGNRWSLSGGRPRLRITDATVMSSFENWKPRRVAIIMDMSGSMHNVMHQAYAVRKRVLSSLAPGEFFAVRPDWDRSEMRRATAETMLSANMDIEVPAGDSALLDWLPWAAGCRPTDIVLISDFALGNAEGEELLANLRDAVAAGVRCDLFITANESTPQELQKQSKLQEIVSPSGGHCWLISGRLDELDEAAASRAHPALAVLRWPAVLLWVVFMLAG